MRTILDQKTNEISEMQTSMKENLEHHRKERSELEESL